MENLQFKPSDTENIEARIVALEKLAQEIRERNRRVELEKAWETSALRRAAILILTYLIASLALYLIGVQEFWLNAIIPTLGYLLSTLSISLLKTSWMGTK